MPLVLCIKPLDVPSGIGAGERTERVVERGLTAADAQLTLLESLDDDLVAGA